MGKHPSISMFLQLMLITILLISVLSPPTVSSHQHTRTNPINTELTEKWIVHYDGTGQDYDKATAMELDSNGNIYITGLSRGIQYYDIVTIKYTAEGEQQWTARWNNPKSSLNDMGADIAIDEEGNVYVTGKSLIGQNEYNIVILKYNTDGDLLWEDSYYGGISTALDYPEKIVLDDYDNLYVCGSAQGETSWMDIVIFKYTVDGRRLWVQTYNGASNKNDTARNIVVKDRDVIVVGEETIIEYNSDSVTLKYSDEGELLWVKNYNLAGYNDVATAAVIDEQGSIYVAGSSNSEVAYLAYDYVTIKYDPDGGQQWLQIYDALEDDPENISIEFVSDIKLTGEDTVIVTGESTDWIGEENFPNYYATICYDTDGTQNWAHREFVYRAEPPSLIIDHVGNIYIGASKAGGPSTHDYFLMRYLYSGETAWIQTYNGNGDYWDKGSDIAVDSQGTVMITGFSTGAAANYDYTTIAYSQQEPPVQPRNPQPADATESVPLFEELEWFSGHIDINEPVTYDVYFGTTSSPPLVSANQSERSYNPGELSQDTTYYWQIVAWDSQHRSSPGPLWQFSTEGDTTAPEVSITKPENGMIYLADQPLCPRFLSPDPLILGKITIELNVTDSESGIKNVEIYIDDILKANISAPPYEWLWQERTLFTHTITAIAYDNSGNSQLVESSAQKFF